MTDLVLRPVADPYTRPTIADVLDDHGNAVDVCGVCDLLPTVTGWVRATQRACPTHGDTPGPR